MKHPLAALIALLACSCQAPVAPAAQNEQVRLMQGCEETERLLGQMKAAESSFEYDLSGNATVRKALWESMPPNMQDGLAKAIAYQAVCSSGELRAQQVTIRASEGREILKQQTISDFDR